MKHREQIVCLGSYGDLCLILPFAADVFRRTGDKTNIVVAQNYADLLDGVSYVNPIVYPFDWKRGQDADTVKKAVTWIKERCEPHALRWLNPVESNGPRKQFGESFVHEMWHTLGKPHDWRRLPLTFDQRQTDREGELIKTFSAAFGNRRTLPLVLVALDGVASPFPERDDLLRELQQSLPDANVLNLSTIRANRPYDLLGLMDRAKLLISADTLSLHLSAASTVPVIALSRDIPTHWNGTPWHRRYELHVRYSQYGQRKPEIIHTARQVLAGVRRPSQRPIMGLEAHGYNPSLIRWQGTLWSTYRYHPHGSWKTHLALAQLDEATATASRHLPLKVPPELSASSVEDMRLWERDGRLFGSLVVAGVTGKRFQCSIYYGELQVTEAGAELVNVWQPDYGKNDGAAMEKNWVFFEHDGKTHFIYECAPEHTIASIFEDVTGKVFRTPALTWAWGQIRGGTPPLPFQGKWLRFFHSQMPISDKLRDSRYNVGAYVMNNEPPFEMLAISKHPVLSGHEWRSPSSHWKSNVMIPYGAVEQGDGWLVSVGVNDSAACLVKLEEKHLNL